MIAPQARGLEVPDAAGIPAFMEQVQRNLHLFGRYGITMFAISGLDIALWDLAGKVKGVPLHRLLGDIKRTQIPAYASLLRIGKPELIAGECQCGAAARLFRDQAARDHDTGGVCRARGNRRRHPADGRYELPAGRRDAIAFAHSCRDAKPMFLEEPVWPPEDFATLAEVRAKGGLDIAAGENACTVYQFRQMMKAGAVSHAQPSVTKVGGITEFLKVAALADELGVKIVPHSPYFGPGLLATLQLMALRDDGFIEMFYMKRAACLWRGRIDADANGNIERAARAGPRLRAGQGRSWSNTACLDGRAGTLRVIARSDSDEAIHLSSAPRWIASLRSQ